MINSLNLDLDFELNKTKKQIDRTVTRLNTLRGKWEGLLRAELLIQKERKRQREQDRQINEL